MQDPTDTTPKPGWSKSSGSSPLKAHLEELVGHLKDLRDETVLEHEEQMKKLQALLQHSSSHSSHRVKK